MRRQLEIEASGLAGNLDKVWPDVRDSAWIGGNCEGWERVPYWLDGFIPLAYLLENEDMIERAKKYVDAIVKNQKPSGWICPCEEDKIESYDPWAVILITKVLTVYYDCSRDARIPDVIYKTLRNYYELLKSGKAKLFQWGKCRWFEAFIAINFIYGRCKEEWLIDLAAILCEQGADYASVKDEWIRPLNVWQYNTHIVNIAMMLKTEAVTADLLGDKYKGSAEELRSFLDKYNGTVTGIFTGDECLSGISPIQGTELCAVVEQMYSYELLFAATNEDRWAQRLEKIAFNALPATFTDDMWAHQYVQQANQIACERFRGKSVFRTNGYDSSVFGLEPEYGCCTANQVQGWPKFALSAFMKRDNEIISAVPIPSKLDCEDAKIELVTDYPFKNEFVYKIKAKKNIKFTVRIPSFAKEYKVNGKDPDSKSRVSFEIKAGEEKEIKVSFKTEPRLIARPNKMKSVVCGSLVFSLPIVYEKRMHEYERKGVVRKFPYCDYEYLPKSDWNYGFTSDKFVIKQHKVDDIPFSSEHPAITLRTKCAKIDWGYEDGYDNVCAKIPNSAKAIDKEEEITLYPYGCAKLRMTEMPLVKGK